MKLTKSNIQSLIGKTITFLVSGYEANGVYNGIAVIKGVDFSKKHPIACETISGDDLSYAFIDMDGESFTYSDNDRPVEVFVELEERIAALGNGCRVEIESSVADTDKDGNLILFCADGCIHAAAYIYSDGELFHLHDWQSGRPESLDEIGDFEWLTEDGREAIIYDNRPKRLL